MIDMDSKFLWAEAEATAVYIKNRLPHSALLKQQTPYEALKGKKPSIKHLQPFGQKFYMHIAEEVRPSGSKLLLRAIEGRFLGYEKSGKIYRIWNPAKPNQVLISHNVRFPPLELGEAGVTLELGIATTTPEKESTSTLLGDSDFQQMIPQEILVEKPLTTEEEIETSEHLEPPAVDTDSELSDIPEESQLCRRKLTIS